jgi:hypothetical protein
LSLLGQDPKSVSAVASHLPIVNLGVGHDHLEEVFKVLINHSRATVHDFAKATDHHDPVALRVLITQVLDHLWRYGLKQRKESVPVSFRYRHQHIGRVAENYLIVIHVLTILVIFRVLTFIFTIVLHAVVPPLTLTLLAVSCFVEKQVAAGHDQLNVGLDTGWPELLSQVSNALENFLNDFFACFLLENCAEVRIDIFFQVLDGLGVQGILDWETWAPLELGI